MQKNDNNHTTEFLRLSLSHYSFGIISCDALSNDKDLGIVEAES